MKKWWMEQPKESEAKKLRAAKPNGEVKVSKLALDDCVVFFEEEEVEMKVKGIGFQDGKFYYKLEEK